MLRICMPIHFVILMYMHITYFGASTFASVRRCFNPKFTVPPTKKGKAYSEAVHSNTVGCNEPNETET
jgi:hypothetical protein